MGQRIAQIKGRDIWILGRQFLKEIDICSKPSRFPQADTTPKDRIASVALKVPQHLAFYSPLQIFQVVWRRAGHFLTSAYGLICSACQTRQCDACDRLKITGLQ